MLYPAELRGHWAIHKPGNSKGQGAGSQQFKAIRAQGKRYPDVWRRTVWASAQRVLQRSDATVRTAASPCLSLLICRSQ